MQLADLTWRAVQALHPNTPVVLPVAALEQHGHHLPVFTDSLLLGEILRRSSERFHDRILFAPLLWLGNSDHHLDFPGTLSAPPRVYLDLLGGLMENFVRHGFRRIVFLNGHGGNDVPGRQATFEIRQQHRTQDDLLLLFATYWHLADPVRIQSLGLAQTRMGHACEWETSMLLRMAPQLVGDHQSLPDISQEEGFSPAARAWITPDRTAVGHIGHPRAATAEKGELLLQTFTDGVVRFLERVLAWDGQSWEG